MAANEITADRAEALRLLRRALALMDGGNFGIAAAPYVDLGLHLLAQEAGQAGGQAIDVK